MGKKAKSLAEEKSNGRPAHMSARLQGCQSVSLLAFKPLTIKPQKKFSKNSKTSFIFKENTIILQIENLVKNGTK